MSVITSYTITCDKKLRDDGSLLCPRVIGPEPTLELAREAAEAAGWKVDYGFGVVKLDGDRCPDHVPPLSRVRWD